jgi:glycerophosphoryl diester phosphodiesterase
MRHLKIIASFVLIIYISSCKKESTSFNIQNMNNKVLALGHGGSGELNLYPMNTYESIMNCLDAGSDGTEWDIQMTKDSVLVAYHDETLETQTNGHGSIIDYTWTDLQKVQYTPAPYVTYAMVSVDTLFQHLPNLHQLTFSFDNKLYFDDSYRAIFIRAIIRLLEKYQMEQNVFIESHEPTFLTQFKLLKDYKFFLNPDTFEDGLSLAESNGFYGIIMDVANLTADQISTAHQHGLYVQVWGATSKDDNIAAVQKNPDTIQTDNIGALVSLLKNAQ